MENNYLDGDVNTHSLNNGLSSLDKEYLMEAAKWARFLGIVGFVGTGFVVLLAFFMMTMGRTISSLANTSDSPFSTGIFSGFGIGMGILYLLIGLLYFYISLYLFNFGKKTQFALRSNDSETLTGGLENLKSFFKVSGIVTAIFIGLYAFTFVFGLLFAGLAVMK